MRQVLRRLRAILRRVLIAAMRYIAPQRHTSIRTLTFWHFVQHSDLQHINRQGLTVALKALNGAPARIVETGTSAWGTDSTRLWAAYVSSFGGELWTVDVRPEAKAALGDLGPRVHFEVDDSVQFLRRFAEASSEPIGLAYLDSWDVDWIDPLPSALHGLSEWNALAPLLAPGSIVVVDDTPADLSLIPEQFRSVAQHFEDAHGTLPGKGALILEEVRRRSDVEVLYHHYNLVLAIRA